MELKFLLCLLRLMGIGEVVARRLRHLRLWRGLSQEELAGNAGLNRNYVGMIERKENSPTVATLEKLAAVLEVDPALFFIDEPSPSTEAELARSRRKPRRVAAERVADQSAGSKTAKT